ncbi:MAG: ATP-dependent DNA helicase RecG [Caldimicrobium sp.]|nr:ATP-dependent DNA helicase RecG [Caldimicrobium sp.]MCX7874158.1 ATP-dependent DNA helicase RecG [Caldimicrobium sp.]MDW8093708.1 ATP-dependent DNA helicase RecG [Caldimicrobium sp.]
MEDWFKSFINIINSLSRGNFSLLAKAKAEHTFLSLLERCPHSLPEEIRQALKNLCLGFDGLSLEEKKKRLSQIKEFLEGLSTANQEGTEEQYPPLPSLSVYRKNREILSSSISQVKGIGSKIAKKFEKKDIKTIEDLLFFLPKTYEDRRSITPIARLKVDDFAVVFGEVLKSGINFYSRRRVYEALLTDGSGLITLKWFNFHEATLRSLLAKGKRLYAIGTVSRFLNQLEMVHPEIILEDDEEKISRELGLILPIYPSVERIPESTIRKIMKGAVDEYLQYLDNLIPPSILKKAKVPPVKKALEALHKPSSTEKLETLLRRDNIYYKSLAFEELFFLQLAFALRKSKLKIERGISFRVDSPLVNDFLQKLPFTLTPAQKRVIEEIKRDMAKEVPMNRLIQGDVGCGKTIVAFVSALVAIDNGYQVALMAPTEILAEQHYRNFRQYTQLMGIRYALLTGGISPSRKREVYQGLATGYLHFVIGTHALFQENVDFKKLGLVIIDEQHRFGVLQRAALRAKAKGAVPDTLVMTATPIPRTLALTVYGDLDVSIIDEMPQGRKPIKTTLFFESNKTMAYEALRQEIKKGHQAYVVLPLIEESETLELKSVLSYGEELQKKIFPEFRVGILHGKMSSIEKDNVMQAFKRGEIDILVSTTVVEVGVDVPNATVMLIEHAERFGLSQLHQLRGRVGRSDKQSYCFLIGYNLSPESEAYRRLKILCNTTDGFKIAEEDLKIRGPGELLGTQQSGFLELKRADPVQDVDLLFKARDLAFELINEDPSLEKYPALKEELFRRWEERLKLSEIA